jgi:hypothetical protein
MKKSTLLVAAIATLSLGACHDDHEACHECHIAYLNAANEEVEVEIGEFCEEALEDVEANGYTLAEDVIVGADTVPAGDYPEVHCEEHADH